MKSTFKTLAFTLLTFLGLLAYGNESSFPEVSLEELKQVVEAKSATLLDANGVSTYKSGHIPTAISFKALKGKLATTLPKDKTALVIAYCGGPMCSAWEDAAEAAKKLGYTNVKHFKGGIKGWREAKLAVEPQN